MAGGGTKGRRLISSRYADWIPQDRVCLIAPSSPDENAFALAEDRVQEESHGHHLRSGASNPAAVRSEPGFCYSLAQSDALIRQIWV